jgi:hypothetical protein
MKIWFLEEGVIIMVKGLQEMCQWVLILTDLQVPQDHQGHPALEEITL